MAPMRFSVFSLAMLATAAGLPVHHSKLPLVMERSGASQMLPRKTWKAVARGDMAALDAWLRGGGLVDARDAGRGGL